MISPRLRMTFHLPETKQYLENLLREIDSQAQPSGEIHLGKCLEEEEVMDYDREKSESFVSFFPSIKLLVKALREYLTFDQYPILDNPRFLPNDTRSVLESYLVHSYWEMNAQFDDESSMHRKAMRQIRKIIPRHVIQTLDTIYDIQNGAVRQNLEGLSAYFYEGTKGYAIEFSILPEDCTNLKVGNTSVSVGDGISLIRTDLMTLILSYSKSP